MARRLTKRFLLPNEFNTAAQQVLDRTVSLVPNASALAAWQAAKERFLQELHLIDGT
jgi:hypothetical protein